ncbi:unnamed protein product [Staurois parvus]|uniref:Protein phosphatase 1 regulatory subunit 7 n=1 Tax=Staurois parvus TaxID=386267 RepID=A0ABN9EK69_9NEOB|nr:unnamed protein product [Staurois parvus]
METLSNLTVLSVQSNRLTKIEGLKSLVHLRELYLSDNGIQVLEGVENNKKLTTLDVASNRIKKIENIRHLTELQEFWMNDNLVDNWADLDNLQTRKGFFTVRAVKMWNRLPQELVLANSVDCFKKGLDCFLDTQNITGY